MASFRQNRRAILDAKTADRRRERLERDAYAIAVEVCKPKSEKTFYPDGFAEMAAMIAGARSTCAVDAPDMERARRITARGVGYKEFAQHYAENDGS